MWHQTPASGCLVSCCRSGEPSSKNVCFADPQCAVAFAEVHIGTYMDARHPLGPPLDPFARFGSPMRSTGGQLRAPVWVGKLQTCRAVGPRPGPAAAAGVFARPQPHPSEWEAGAVGRGPSSPHPVKWDHTTPAPSAEEDGPAEGLS